MQPTACSALDRRAPTGRPRPCLSAASAELGHVGQHMGQWPLVHGLKLFLNTTIAASRVGS